MKPRRTELVTNALRENEGHGVCYWMNIKQSHIQSLCVPLDVLERRRMENMDFNLRVSNQRAVAARCLRFSKKFSGVVHLDDLPFQFI